MERWRLAGHPVPPAPRSGSRTKYLWALGVSILLLFRPLYTGLLRHELRVESPEAWEQLETNGRFAILVPHLASRYSDEAHYAGRVNQILLHGFPYHGNWSDLRGFGSWVQGSIPLYVLAGFGALCRGDLNAAWCLAVSVLGALWFLAFHRVFGWWSGREPLALVFALLSVLFPDLYLCFLRAGVTWEQYADALLQVDWAIRPDFYRLPAMMLTSLLLFGLFLCAVPLATKERYLPMRAACLGAGFGLMAWVHQYDFSFGMATLGVFCVAAYLSEKPRAVPWNAVTTFLVALSVSGSCVAALWLSSDPGALQDWLWMLGREETRQFHPSTVTQLVVAGIGFWASRREADRTRRLALVLLASAEVGFFLCRNQQVLLGFSLQGWHYARYGSFAALLMTLMLLAGWLARIEFPRRRTAVALAIGLVLWSSANEVVAAQRLYKLLGLSHDVEEGLLWMNRNVPKDGLVLTPSMETTILLPAYTHTKTRVPSLAYNPFPSTKDEYLRRVAQLLKSCRIDVPRFLRERWVSPRELNELDGRLLRELRLFGRVDREAIEPSFWFYGFPFGKKSDEETRSLKERFLQIYAEVEPISPPFHLWANERDRHLFDRPPTEFGGRLVFENATVRVYEFR